MGSKPFMVCGLLAPVLWFSFEMCGAQPTPQQAQETILVPEQVTTYRLVYETTFEEKKEVRYQPVWQQEWVDFPQVVSKPVVTFNGQVYLQNMQQMMRSPIWTYRLSPQESIENVPNVKASWKPHTVTRYVPRQVPVGTPAPPKELGKDVAGESGVKGADSGDTEKNGDTNGQRPDTAPESKQLKDELDKLKRENERLKNLLGDLLADRKDKLKD